MPKIQKISIANPRSGNTVDWLNINSPGKAEIEFLRKNYNFKLPQLHASSAKANSQRTIIARENDYVFLILHFPAVGADSGKITAAEIEFFIGHGFLVTLPSQAIEPLNDLFRLCKKDKSSLLSAELTSSAVLLYEILNKLLEYSYVQLDQNSLAISQAEKIILSEDQKKAAGLVLNLRHNLINMRKIVQNHKNIIKQLMAMPSSLIPADQLKKYYGRLIEQTKNIWETLENQREMVEVLYDSQESLANYKLSSIMKTLTIFYVIFSSLSLIAAIFSMNLAVGTANFWLTIGAMAAAGLIMFLVFKIKKWL
ncbi:MAG: CorA family divalent cation transporter [bacterium]|nr:CorA family divalent cation transporter [bacterium]